MNDETTTHTLAAGFVYRPIAELTLDISATYAHSEAGLDQFYFDRAAAYVAAHPTYALMDYSLVPDATDLGANQWQAGVGADWRFHPKWDLTARYTYGDYDDTEEYLYDMSGSSHLFTVGFRYHF
jgi:opacity protein-like surface antigen